LARAPGTRAAVRAAARATARGCARAGRPARALALAQLAAALAARGGMRQALLAKERLLAGGEQEVLAAIHALDDLVFARRHDAPCLPRGFPPKTMKPRQRGCRGGSHQHSVRAGRRD